MGGLIEQGVLEKLNKLAKVSTEYKVRVDAIVNRKDECSNAWSTIVFVVALAVAMSGRAWEKTKGILDLATSVNGGKGMKHFNVPKLKDNKIKVTLRTRVFTLMHLAGILIPYDSIAEWLKSGLMLICEDGLISEETRLMLIKSVAKTGGNGRIKGMDSVIEIERLVNGFNDHKKYGYEMLVVIDAKAQN